MDGFTGGSVASQHEYDCARLDEVCPRLSQHATANTSCNAVEATSVDSQQGHQPPHHGAFRTAAVIVASGVRVMKVVARMTEPSRRDSLCLMLLEFFDTCRTSLDQETTNTDIP